MRGKADVTENVRSCIPKTLETEQHGLLTLAFSSDVYTTDLHRLSLLQISAFRWLNLGAINWIM